MQSTSKTCTTASPLGHLEKLLAKTSEKSHPPVHRWDPEARPDIGLAIRRDASWTHQGDPITRHELVKLFASVLRREADGQTFLVTPVEKVPVKVADAPFLAVELQVKGEGRRQKLIWRTNVDDVVVAGAKNTIRFAQEEPAGGMKPYLMIRHGLEARVTRALYYDLVALAVVESIDGGEKFGVWSDGTFFAMADASDLEGDDTETGAAT